MKKTMEQQTQQQYDRMLLESQFRFRTSAGG